MNKDGQNYIFYVFVSGCLHISLFLARPPCSLQYTKYLIFDEADKMLDLGFEKAISEVVEGPA